VTRVGTGAFAVLAATLAATTLVACGGSDSGSEASTTESLSGSTAKAHRGQQSNGRSAEQKGSGKAAGSDQSGSPQVRTPLQVSGGGSGQFREKGGDNSIQEFGEESSESELKEAAVALHSFYVARAEEDWGRACTYLSSSMVAQLEQLAKQSPQLKGEDCPALLHAYTRPLPASVRRETTLIDAGSLRSEGEQSFLIYRGEGGAVFAMPMKDENGGWKIGLLAPTPLG
jgi:hypothetical protein